MGVVKAERIHLLNVNKGLDGSMIPYKNPCFLFRGIKIAIDTFSRYETRIRSGNNAISVHGFEYS
jgi:hypothetical protein